jgi:hypothetical protein
VTTAHRKCSRVKTCEEAGEKRREGRRGPLRNSPAERGVGDKDAPSAWKNLSLVDIPPSLPGPPCPFAFLTRGGNSEGLDAKRPCWSSVNLELKKALRSRQRKHERKWETSFNQVTCAPEPTKPFTPLSLITPAVIPLRLTCKP